MTNKATKNKLQVLLCTIVALMLVFSLSAVGCSKGDPTVNPSVSVSASEEARELVFANGDFEKITTSASATKYPITSVPSFTKSYDYDHSSTNKAPDKTSAGKSGVVDLSADFGANTDIGLTKEQNPGYCPDVADKTDDLGTHALMIHNGEPTALRYTTSSSLSFTANKYAKISVWVYTDQIKNYLGEDAAEGSNFGANITITGASNTYDPVSLRNINTFGEWKQYSVYLAASDFESSTVYVALGLGKGTSSRHDEFVKGYAFFDELVLEYVSAAEYYEAEANAVVVNRELTGAQKIVNYGDVANKDKATAINHKTVADEVLANGVTVAPVVSTLAAAPTDAEGKKGLVTLDEAKAIDAAAFENFPFDGSSKLLMIENKIATAYYALSDEMTIPSNTCKVITVFVKTSAVKGTTGAGISLVTTGANGASDPAKYVYNSFTNIDTSTADHSEEKNYFWDGWTQYNFFVKNASTTDMTVALRMSMGPTDVNNLNPLDLTKGWAAFTEVKTADISSAQYSSASSSSTTNKKVDLYYDTYKVSYAGGFDTRFANNTEDYMQNPATPSSWTELSGNDKAIGGETAFSKENVVSGLVNSAYWTNYKTNHNLPYELSDWYDANTIGDNPLMIYNDEFASFGYASAKKTLSANTSYQISVRVKVIGADAKAYFYLTNSDLSLDEPYGVKTFDVPASSVNEAYSGKYVIALEDSTGLNMSSTPELINLGDGWMILSFFVTTGDTAVNYRAEVWNGERNATSTETGYSRGCVFFQNFEQTSLTAEKMELARDEYMNHYNLTAESAGVVQYLREKLESDAEDPTAEIVYIPTTYAVFTDYTELDIVEEETEDDGSLAAPTSSCKTNFDYNVLLWLSTLILAIALIAVLIVLVTRSIKTRMKRKEKTKLSGKYDKDKRAELHKKLVEKRAAAEKAAAEREAAEKAAAEREAAELAAAEKAAAEQAAKEAEEAARAAEEAEKAAAAETAEEVAEPAEESAEATAEEEAPAEEAAPETPAEEPAPVEEAPAEEAAAPAEEPTEAPAEEPKQD